MEPSESPQISSEGQEQGSASRKVFLSTWAFWVLASAIGGAAGGAVFILDFIGQLLLFGGILGAAQALVVWRYARGWTSVRWVAASSLGWPAGWLAASFARLALQGLVPELFQRPGFEQLVVYRFFEPVVWTVFGAFQCIVFSDILGRVQGTRRQSLLPLAVVWMVASALGGALAVAASFAINMTVLPSGDGNSFWGVILPQAVGQAAGGVLYGAVTGLVIARIVRQGA